MTLPASLKSGEVARLLPVTGGGKTWSALVEAKIGKADLEPEQVERYLTLAKASSIDAVITISNQFATIPTHSPVKVSRAAVKGIALYQ